MTSHMVQFWIDFASGSSTRTAGELYLVGDEFHNFAPKGKIMDPQAGKCLHWSNRLLSEGRGPRHRLPARVAAAAEGAQRHADELRNAGRDARDPRGRSRRGGGVDQRARRPGR
jgi:hypothetical protein